MNELKIFEAINLIDDDLVKEADEKPETQAKLMITKNRLYAISSVAAAAVITVGSVAFYNAHKPSDLLIDHSAIQSDDSIGGDNNSDNQGIPTATNSDSNTQGTEPIVQTTKSTNTDEGNSSEQPTTQGTVTTVAQGTDSNSQEDSTTDGNTQTQRPDDNTTSGNQTTLPPQVTTQEPKQTDQSVPMEVSNYYYQMFNATVDPYSDAYGQDEIPLVSVIVSGNYYYQIDSLEHPANNISPVISDGDFGEYIGNIVELFEYDDSAKYVVSSKEPNLAGAEVYYYASADSSSVIIVKKGEQCSIFVFNGMADVSDSNNSVFAETFKLYGAESAEAIQSISFSIASPNGAVMEVTSQGTITDRDKINSIVDILYQLTPEKNTDSLSATPEWLIDAWNEYKANPDAYIREDITLDITFNNGTVLKDISYQPYLGNGYISGMQELTSEQNTALRELLG